MTRLIGGPLDGAEIATDASDQEFLYVEAGLDGAVEYLYVRVPDGDFALQSESRSRGDVR